MKYLVILLAILSMSFNADRASSYMYRVIQNRQLCGCVAVEYDGAKRIATANHCVDESGDAVVDGKPVKVLERNVPGDIALLEVPDHIKVFARLAPLPAVGSPLYVWAFPEEEFVLTHGVVGGKCRMFGQRWAFPMDAKILPGSSGGAVFDKDERVIGIVSFGYPGVAGIAYAVCTDRIMDLLK